METLLIRAEIDLGAIAHNTRQLRRACRPEARFMAVVKADGYGHGAVKVAETVLQNGADRLAVARVEEALGLRAAGIGAPILIFGHTPPSLTSVLVENDLTQTVSSFEVASQYADALSGKSGPPLRLHLKIDSGMGRLGMVPDLGRLSMTGKAMAGHTLMEIESIVRLPGIEVEGIYTHLACADLADKGPVREQLGRFTDLLERLWLTGIEIPIKHAANSAGLMDLPESHLDMVRPGIALYGLYPSAETGRDRVVLKPAMSLFSTVIHVKSVPEGFSVGYGATYTTPGPTTIATVAAGYADGVSRRLSNNGRMLVNQVAAPIVGRVCMDLTMLDVGEVPGAAVGDRVLIFGRDGEKALPVDEVADRVGTIHYEIVCGISKRVPRIYVAP